MAAIRGRVRARLRERIIAGRDAHAFNDSNVFDDVESLLYAAASTADPATLILPELLGAPDAWRLTTSIRYQSHRANRAAALFGFVKRSMLMPVVRWLFEYSRDNFERQRRTNLVLFACVQELAIETAQLRRDVRRLSPVGETARPGAHPTSSAES
jgi:hypothetical protein